MVWYHNCTSTVRILPTFLIYYCYLIGRVWSGFLGFWNDDGDSGGLDWWYYFQLLYCEHRTYHESPSRFLPFFLSFFLGSRPLAGPWGGESPFLPTHVYIKIKKNKKNKNKPHLHRTPSCVECHSFAQVSYDIPVSRYL